MRFEPNYFKNENNENEFRNVIDFIHSWDSGCNWEQSCRLWYTQDGETIMVEHDVATLSNYILMIESGEEPTYQTEDYLTAYLVTDEKDYDTSTELGSTEINDYISLHDLKHAMEMYAKSMFE